MEILRRSGRTLVALALVLMLTVTTACSSATTQAKQTGYSAQIGQKAGYDQLARGNTATGQDFGNWVVQTARGLVKDAYVRDNDKLGVVISDAVHPSEVKSLTQSLVQGFRHNFPNQNLTVLMYAPDKQLILTARYDPKSKQVEYQQAS
ncbi:MAG TPA: hypothetical protein V6C57_12795 [Coleofasciculaceae cyanobacterium]